MNVTDIDTKRRCRNGDGRVVYSRALCQPCYREATHAGTLPPREGAYGEITLPDLKALGISYRQLDYWTRTGLIESSEATPGSGHRRYWPEEELEVAGRIARLVKAGVNIRVAAEIARQPGEPVHLDGGVIVTVLSVAPA